ncbi:serine/threonine-protein phosphatase 6 regulatory ankyrin repeat subunit A-like [Oncorhynchus tshawytscha]|uniref:serine/threonine-protein phosphatase 6 regulatory ankyrin repeat subunit A-like n=1 Tax=Oncorhynchus tshawytscha TaxID=74940 RepID=UPI001C3D0F4C|nr:serine/threonine-protein phosphatase 6 regulatory ankyrin repeat subunit A-like [Oncorhynchus tshawytscha]
MCPESVSSSPPPRLCVPGVNAKDKCLNTLHRAVTSCSEEAVQVLLKHSADVNARDKNWQTPLHIAAANKAVRCAEALVLSNVNMSDRALHHAAYTKRLAISMDMITHCS